MAASSSLEERILRVDLKRSHPPESGAREALLFSSASAAGRLMGADVDHPTRRARTRMDGLRACRGKVGSCRPLRTSCSFGASFREACVILGCLTPEESTTPDRRELTRQLVDVGDGLVLRPEDRPFESIFRAGTDLVER